METRPLGDTGHDSSVVTLGTFALQYLTQPAADHLVELAVRRGVNHFDVAPTYGDAELKLGPKLREHRDRVFLGCKTGKRDREGARAELEQSLNRLGVDKIDLYQFHAVGSSEELDEITGDGGALEAFRAAKEEGLVDHVGLTSHGHPDVILEGIDRIDDLATVMFPMNAVVLGKADADHDYEAVLDRVEDEGLGALGIKAFARGPWPDDLPERDRTYGTWYEPVDRQHEIDERLNVALSQGMTSLTNPGDPKLFPMVLDAADRYAALDPEERAAVVDRESERESPVPADLD